MSEISILSSSLHTDSDCSDDSVTETFQVRRIPVTARNQDPLTADQYVEQMLAQVRDEACLDINNSSFEISSNHENSFCQVNFDDLVETDKINSINHKLARNFTKALMNYKSTTRPILSGPPPKGLNLQGLDDFSTIEPVDRSFQLTENKRQHRLSYSLNELKNLQKIRRDTKNSLQNKLIEINTIDKEREKLKEKLNHLSESLDYIIKEKKSMNRSSCQCVVF